MIRADIMKGMSDLIDRVVPDRQQQQRQGQAAGSKGKGGRTQVAQLCHLSSQLAWTRHRSRNRSLFPASALISPWQPWHTGILSSRIRSSAAAGRTPKQMEDADDHKWRAAGSKQRWSEYMVLLNAIETKQQQLMDDQRALGRRGVHVSITGSCLKLWTWSGCPCPIPIPSRVR